MWYKKINGVLGIRLLTVFVMVITLALSYSSVALATGTVGTAAGFEDDDGNLAAEAPVNFDWNSIAPLTWMGTAPYRMSDAFVSGWTFKGIEDAQAVNSDSAFAGGVKQDDSCPIVKSGKAPNKDDLKRIYLATKVIGGHTYLMLSWVRIPQNTTSPSAHIGFEFNKGTDGPCDGSSDGLVKRVDGDMLIVYDFEGGSTNSPTITLRRWTTNPGDVCEVGNDSPPCWGTAADLTALGFAEAKVNTFGSVSDALAPNPPENLGTNEFGEAGIDLTGAEVFTAGTCESFGTAFGVSRSSGNSGTAQMKDLIGPADFTLANCGTVIVHKLTDPSGDTTTSFGYTTDVTTTPETTTYPFSLKDGETNTISNVNPGSFYVTEDDPSPNYTLSDIDCSASTTAADPSVDLASRTTSFTIGPAETVECTFTNTLQQGAIQITKTSAKDSSGLQGAKFSITSGGSPISGSPFTTDVNGQVCVDGLSFGDYVVTETAAPDGYQIDDASDHTVTVDNNAKCSDDPYVGETSSFSDTPLSKIQVVFTSLAGPGVTNASIVCQSDSATIDAAAENGAADPAFDDTDESFTGLVPGAYTCTVVVDP